MGGGLLGKSRGGGGVRMLYATDRRKWRMRGWEDGKEGTRGWQDARELRVVQGTVSCVSDPGTAVQ